MNGLIVPIIYSIQIEKFRRKILTNRSFLLEVIYVSFMNTLW